MNTLIIFAREPADGQVKTRLLKALDAPTVTALYRQFVKEAIAAGRRADCAQKWIYYTGTEQEPVFLMSAAEGYFFRKQSGPDLGGRMLRAFEDHAGRPVVIAGSDCPALCAGDIDEAFRRLNEHDLVLGPARDGGYYLIGARRPYAELFEGMAWGTDSVFDETVKRAREAGLKTALLPPKQDIDDPEDLRELSRRLADYPQLSPETVGLIRRAASTS